MLITGSGDWNENGVGKGRFSTKAMLRACTSGAANEADSYSTETKMDWFLPTIRELILMHDNLADAGVGDFTSSSSYWSSSEMDRITAWMYYFPSGIQGKLDKNYKLQVRAIRAFSENPVNVAPAK